MKKSENSRSHNRLEDVKSSTELLMEHETYNEIYKDLTDITQQVQMIAECLTNCRRVSRPSKTEIEMAVNFALIPDPQKPIQILLPSEERRVEYLPFPEDNFIVSYMLKDESKMKYLQRSKTFISREDILTGENWESHNRLLISNEGNVGLIGKSEVLMYNPEDIHPSRMMEVIQRELMVLVDIVPSVSGTIREISDIFFHCKVCSKCKLRIHPALPWILNKIQNLIKYIIVKKKKTYTWPKDHEYLHKSTSSVQVKKNKTPPKKKVTRIKQTLKSFSYDPKSELVQVGKLERVDASVISDDKPGLQIELEVNPKETKKRFLEKAKQVEDLVKDLTAKKAFSVIWKEETSENPYVQILKPKSLVAVSLQKKQVSVLAKGYSISVGFVITYRRVDSLLGLVLTPWECLTNLLSFKIERILKPLTTYEERSYKFKQTTLNEFFHQTGYTHRRLEVKETQTFCPKKVFINVPKAVQELLDEAEEEKMQVEKVRELETEVKGLKDLMLEVHKNQMELSKLLLEKGVYSKPMIRLTDPGMLEEEKELVQKATHFEVPGRRSSSMETLQLLVDDLKRKCSVKNRMIVTLLRGLRSNIPREWWEELEAYIFDETKSMEEIDPEKVNEFVRQTSLFLMDDDQASSTASPSAPLEELPREEEPKPMRGNSGVEVGENLKIQEFLKKKSFGSKSVSAGNMESSAFLRNRETEITLKKMENQISVLNNENERLWHEVHELREILKESTTNNNAKNQALARSNHLPTSKPSKTINLTIQIGEKGTRWSKIDRGLYKVSRIIDPTIKELPEPSLINAIQIGKSNSSAIVKLTDLESSSDVESNEKPDRNLPVPYKSDQKLSLRILSKEDQKNPVRSKSERRKSENDLNYLDDYLPEYVSSKQDKVREILEARLNSREASFEETNKNLIGGTDVRTPHPSEHEIYHPNLRSMVSMPSKYILTSDTCQAGPSSVVRRQIQINHLPQKPSVMELVEKQNPGMFATMGNERELQTIPECEFVDSSTSSQNVNQTIQKLRTRVRSMHKDVTLLKSKNDKVDKLLDKLLDCAVENNQNFENMENDVNKLKVKLG